MIYFHAARQTASKSPDTFDLARALLAVIEKGVPGQTYNIGGNN